jgi:uncharacterized protein YggE
MKLSRGLILLTVCSIGISSVAKAEDPGITVTATGEATVKPNRMEIEVKASASAELTGDAVVKYRDGLRRAKEAFEKLKIENLQVEDRGMNVANGAVGATNNNFVALNGGAPAAAKPEVNISKSLRLAVTGVDKLSEEQLIALVAKLLDTAKDAGVSPGGNSTNSLLMRMNGMAGPTTMVTFIADDTTAARKKATADAFHQAHEKAQKLAELAGVTLGPVISMEDIGASAEKGMSMQERMVQMIYGGGDTASDDSRLTSSLLIEMPVRVGLRVRFALQSGGAAK